MHPNILGEFSHLELEKNTGMHTLRVHLLRSVIGILLCVWFFFFFLISHILSTKMIILRGFQTVGEMVSLNHKW